MKPTLASSGAEALSALRKADSKNSFALVLLDVHMPDMDGFAVAEQIRNSYKQQGLKVILLTSASRPSDVARCRELGISDYLSKPIKQSELFDAIVTAMAEHGRKRERYESASAFIQASERSLRVLLAEDNPVNQTLAMRILEKLGHKVQVVNNGREALGRSQAEEFDLILMDVQMPEMDGLEATTAIRAAEASTGKHVPIVAMTAHAMKGDREKCLSAGMDGYLSKPIRIDELKQAMSEVKKTQNMGQSSEQNAFRAIGQLELLLDSVMGDRALLTEMAELWLADSAKQESQIRNGLDSGDGDYGPEGGSRTQGLGWNISGLCRAGRREPIGNVRERCRPGRSEKGFRTAFDPNRSGKAGSSSASTSARSRRPKTRDRTDAAACAPPQGEVVRNAPSSVFTTKGESGGKHQVWGRYFAGAAVAVIVLDYEQVRPPGRILAVHPRPLRALFT